MQLVAPATAHQSGLPLAVATALSVTALAALGMVISQLRRASRPSLATGGLGAASAAGAVLALAALSGSPPPPVAAVPFAVTDYAVETFQLETLAVE
jgi:hypothetical protein